LRNAIANTFLSTTVLSLLTVITGRLWEIIRNMNASIVNRVATWWHTTMVAAVRWRRPTFTKRTLRPTLDLTFPVENKTTKVDLIMRKSQNA
jgi:hypothetical protein